MLAAVAHLGMAVDGNKLELMVFLMDGWLESETVVRVEEGKVLRVPPDTTQCLLHNKPPYYIMEMVCV